MRQQPQAGPGGRVVHLAPHLDERMLDLLGPAAEALARAGREQAVVLIDEPARRALLTRFDAAVDIVSVPPHRNPWAQWQTLAAAFAREVGAAPTVAAHLHGFRACLLGERVLGQLGLQVPTVYSPHGGGAIGRWQPLATAAHLLGRAGHGGSAARAIGHGSAEAQGLRSLAHRSVALVEGPVPDAFFAAQHHGARHPLVVGGERVHDMRAVELFDQLAVLLGGDAVGLGFNWIGPVDAVSAARLHAAGVGVFAPRDPAERAMRLAAGWVFVALGGGHAFPHGLAEAMASGLPCVAADTPAHRALVHHGHTGYLCRGQAEIVSRIAQLVDTPALRDRLGRAGRELAAERFCATRFDDALIAAYAAPAPRPALRAVQAGLPQGLPTTGDRP